MAGSQLQGDLAADTEWSGSALLHHRTQSTDEKGGGDKKTDRVSGRGMGKKYGGINSEGRSNVGEHREK